MNAKEIIGALTFEETKRLMEELNVKICNVHEAVKMVPRTFGEHLISRYWQLILCSANNRTSEDEFKKEQAIRFIDKLR